MLQRKALEPVLEEYIEDDVDVHFPLIAGTESPNKTRPNESSRREKEYKDTQLPNADDQSGERVASGSRKRGAQSKSTLNLNTS